MANRNFQEKLQSLTRKLVSLHGSISLVQQVLASKVLQGITITAVADRGEEITVRFTTGATAGAEVVTVSNKAITVQIESGVTTVTQARTAINAAPAAAALVSATGTSGSAVTAAAAVALDAGTDGVSDFDINGVEDVKQTGVGEITLTLQDGYCALQWAQFQLQAATAADLVPQLKSNDVVDAKTIVVRLLAAAVPTNPSAAATLYFNAFLRNSTVEI